ncbi:outer membrane beta-barrel protein [Pontibacter qinzhouensis]|uniref:Outer membrane beta-barrel protein n=1 Tax=Pontibacter qinzhouensis TaxID=2603253 RepID=A0A5C8KAV4_9BACT|nr:outer membrane beta-barrel protein [Pontibacter qinzhouensis]TXK49817.1 outer membrane beta-barrel protein [Pontibacter qinzhouensis]
MKKLWLLLLLAATGTTMAYAQTEQGNMVITGRIGGSLSSNEIEDKDYPDGFRRKSSSVSFRPSFGYFIQDRLEVGLSPQIYFSKSHEAYSGVDNIYRSRFIGFAPYIRKYVVLSDKLMAHGTVTASAGFNTSWTDNDSIRNPTKYKSTDLGISIFPGITYFATEKIGITATIGNLGYMRYMSKRREGVKSLVQQNFIADISFSSFTLGINYFIGR